MGHARQERVKLVGTRSADYIRASGHCGCIAMGQASTRKQAVYMAAPERFAKSQICSCNAGTVHTWPISTNRGTSRDVGYQVMIRPKADIAEMTFLTKAVVIVVVNLNCIKKAATLTRSLHRQLAAFAAPSGRVPLNHTVSSASRITEHHWKFRVGFRGRVCPSESAPMRAFALSK